MHAVPINFNIGAPAKKLTHFYFYRLTKVTSPCSIRLFGENYNYKDIVPNECRELGHIGVI